MVLTVLGYLAVALMAGQIFWLVRRVLMLEEERDRLLVAVAALDAELNGLDVESLDDLSEFRDVGEFPHTITLYFN